jgi:hypothetical protein
VLALVGGKSDGVDEAGVEATVADVEGVAELEDCTGPAADDDGDVDGPEVILDGFDPVTAFLFCRPKRSPSYQLAWTSAIHNARTDRSRS